MVTNKNSILPYNLHKYLRLKTTKIKKIYVLIKKHKYINEITEHKAIYLIFHF